MKKVVLITGASSGIGKSIATYLHQNGYDVVGTSRNPAKYPNLPFPLLPLQVIDSQSIIDCINEVFAIFGKIDVLINNAGVGITGPIEEIPTAEMRAHFETNFFGPIELIKAVLPQMRQQKSGLIINVTSLAGYMGLPYRGIYSTSKAALEILTEALRMEVKPFGIDIANVAPGDFATNIAQNRFHLPIFENSPYQKPYAQTLHLINSHVNSGSNPLEMAVAIRRIIGTKNPKIHYKVGTFFQKCSVVLKRMLPDLTYEKMMMKHFKL